MATKTLVDTDSVQTLFNKTLTGPVVINPAGDFSSALVKSTGSTFSRSLANHLGDVVNIKDFGATGNGSTDDTGAIQAAITAVSEGGTVLIPPGYYLFTTLAFTKTVTLRGMGWHVPTQGVFGDTAYFSSARGSILQCTLSSGTALTMQTSNTAPRLVDFALLGPGVNTAGAIAAGDASNYLVLGRWHDVMIANFYQGATLINVEDYVFDTIRFRGISTSALRFTDGGAGSNTNQNLFLNLEVQKSGLGLHLQQASTNRFVGGLFQSNTRDIQFQCSTFGSVASTSFDGLWFEATTTPPIEWDLTNGGPIATSFTDCTMNATGDAWTVTGAGSRVYQLTLINNQWPTVDVTLPVGRIDRFVNLNNRFNSLTNHSATVGLEHPILLTADLPAAAVEMDGTILIEDGGVGVSNLVWYKDGERYIVSGVLG